MELYCGVLYLVLSLLNYLKSLEKLLYIIKEHCKQKEHSILFCFDAEDEFKARDGK